MKSTTVKFELQLRCASSVTTQELLVTFSPSGSVVQGPTLLTTKPPTPVTSPTRCECNSISLGTSGIPTSGSTADLSVMDVKFNYDLQCTGFNGGDCESRVTVG